MNCPRCGFGWGRVLETRQSGVAKRKRRECSGCGHRFTTYEIFDSDYKAIKRVSAVADFLDATTDTIEGVDHD